MITNKRKCFELEQVTRCQHATAATLMTPTFSCHTTIQQNNINHGDYIEVSEDLSPGTILMVEQGLLPACKVMGKTEPSL